jgi:hypothetical protein
MELLGRCVLGGGATVQLQASKGPSENCLEVGKGVLE